MFSFTTPPPVVLEMLLPYFMLPLLEEHALRGSEECPSEWQVLLHTQTARLLAALHKQVSVDHAGVALARTRHRRKVA